MNTKEQREREHNSHIQTAKTVVESGEDKSITSSELLRIPNERIRIAILLALLTLNAGWTDMLAYLLLGHVFSSFLTGNFLFIGLGLAQGNSGLLARASLAVLIFLISTAFGSFCLQRLPQQQTKLTWLRIFAHYLLMEWFLFLAFAIIWQTTSNLNQREGVQIVFLCIATIGMGFQGALAQALNFPAVVANALTGTVLTLGQRLAQSIADPGSESREWKWRTLLMVILCLIYILSALVVVLAIASFPTTIVPVIIITIAVLAMLMPAYKKTPGKSTSSHL